jgi:CRP/FNR family transcriptional regulator, polysaccharide utilization system transcription regulator
LKSDIFISILRHNNAFCFRFLEELASDLADSDARTVNLTQKHIRGRLAESIIFLKQNYGLEEDGATISIYLSREDLANLSNMTTSNAIRTLSNFASEHVITMDGRKLKIIDEERLRKISKMG